MASAAPPAPAGPGPGRRKRAASAGRRTRRKTSAGEASGTPAAPRQRQHGGPLLGATFAKLAHQEYWNGGAAQWSTQLWLPDAGDVETTHAKYSKSWFHTTVVKPTAPREGSSLPRSLMGDAKAYSASCEALKERERRRGRKNEDADDGEGAEADKDDALEPLKTRKIRLHPTPEQAKVLRRFCGAHRWTYNQCVRAQKDGAKVTLEALRTRFVNNNVAPAWALKVPYDIREDGMRDFKKAWAAAAQKAQRSTFKYRSRKRNATDTFSVRHRILNVAEDKASVQFYARFFKKLGVGNTWIATAEPMPDARSDCKLQWDKRAGGWFLCVPIALDRRGDTQALPNSSECKTVALDPGVRAFQTLYDPQRNEVQQWGDDDIKRIVRLCAHLDRLVGKLDAARKALRTAARPERLKAVTRVVNLQRAAGHVRTRIRNLVSDLHHHLAKFLVENYELILLPAFHTSEMVPRKQRKIRRKTARSMLTWAHYRFQQFLLHKAREFPGRHVALVCEGYTSKCCGRCGAIHGTLGGNKVFKCPHCDTTLLRDANGARGVLLRFLSGVDHQALLRELASLGPRGRKAPCESELKRVRTVCSLSRLRVSI
jgi:putative transposase